MMKEILDRVKKMDYKTRMARLIEISLKQNFGTSTLQEDLEHHLIQMIRSANGEIEKVLKDWEANPEMAGLAAQAREREQQTGVPYA